MLSREEKLSAGHTAKPLPGLNAMFQHPTEVVAESDGGRRLWKWYRKEAGKLRGSYQAESVYP